MRSAPLDTVYMVPRCLDRYSRASEGVITVVPRWLHVLCYERLTTLVRLIIDRSLGMVFRALSRRGS